MLKVRPIHELKKNIYPYFFLSYLVENGVRPLHEIIWYYLKRKGKN